MCNPGHLKRNRKRNCRNAKGAVCGLANSSSIQAGPCWSLLQMLQLPKSPGLDRLCRQGQGGHSGAMAIGHDLTRKNPGVHRIPQVSHPMSGDSEDGEATEGFGGGSESLGVHGPGPLELWGGRELWSRGFFVGGKGSSLDGDSEHETSTCWCDLVVLDVKHFKIFDIW